MRRAAIRVSVTVILAVLFVGAGLGLFGHTSDRINQSSAASAAPPPTATYVSELGPAIMLPPRQPVELPPAGAGDGAATLWPKAAGLGLAVVGCLLLHAAVTLRPEPAG
jgi:hypothetical protein